MARYNLIQTNFKGGEITAKGAFATDQDKFVASANEIRNMVVDFDGAAWMRPGTSYVSNIVTISSVDYDLQADDKIFPMLVTNPYTGKKQQWHIYVRRKNATTAAFIQAIPPNSGLQDVISSTYGDAIGVAQSLSGVTNFPNWTYKRTSELTRNETHWSYVQAGNTLFITAGHFQPTFVRTVFDPTDITATPTFVFGPIWAPSTGGFATTLTYQRVPYFLNTNPDLIFTPSGTTGTITIAVTDTSPGNADYFVAGHVGATFKMNAGVFVITAVSNAYTATAVVLDDLSATTAATAWEESCWSEARGWPIAVDYWQNRLVFAGTAAQPDTVWLSQVDDVTEFSLVVGGSLAADSAFDFTISQRKPWGIQWIAGTTNKLFIGTEKGEHSCGAADPNSGLAYNNVNVQSESEFGSIPHQAVIYENAVLFMDKSGKRMRQLVFDDLKRVYDGVEVANFSEFAFDRTRELNEDATQVIDALLDASIRVQSMGTFDVIWILRGSSLFSITINKQREVSALCHHYLGGSGPTGYNFPRIHFMSVGQDADTNGIFRNSEHCYLIVGRSVNDSDEVYVERMGSVFDWYNMEYDADAHFAGSKFYQPELFASHFDCHFYDKVGGTDYLMTKLTHLEGEDVYTLADGFQYGPHTVASGQIDLTADLDSEPDFAISGYRYTARIKTLEQDDGSQIGSSLGSIKKIEKIFVQLFKTVGLKFGYLWKSDNDTLEDLSFIDPNALAGSVIPLFSGKKELEVPGASPDEKAQIVLEHVGPYPCCICGIVYRGQAYD